VRPSVKVLWLGRQKYKPVWDIQKELHNALIQRKLEKGITKEDPPPMHFILVEHEPVVTLGKHGHPNNIVVPVNILKKKGFEFYHIDRGGDVTYHGPGQIVGYPILDLSYFKEDIGWYMRSLEEVVIRTLAEYGIKGERLKGYTGVWLDINDPRKVRKICAMGVRVSRWVTLHGFALNVNTNLHHFGYIIPCGLADKGVTSMERELGKRIPLEDVIEHIIRHFGTVFDVEIASLDKVNYLKTLSHAETI